MPASASPIDIATARQSSHSPRNNHSNLTTQLQQPKIDVQPDQYPSESQPADYLARNRQESVGMLGTTPYGARSIPTRAGQRRESGSNGLSGSMANGMGMSWGGISMGSFIRDDIMTGTSPYNFQSPSFHSSSYLPKMEANYMRDYVCCDIHLESMHDLLQHFEQAHAEQRSQDRGAKDMQFANMRSTGPMSNATQQPVQPPATVTSQQVQRQPSQHMMGTFSNPSPLFAGQSQDPMGNFDNLDDMDMDDAMGSTQFSQLHTTRFQPQPNFGRQQPRGPSLNVSVANAFQGQGLKSATPTTPRANQVNFVGNPTVSSVNTPTLTTQAAMSHATTTPDSSMPVTPADTSDSNGFNSPVANYNNDYGQLMQGNHDFNNLSLNQQNNGNGTIDDPAKRLLSKQGHGNNSELAKRVREQHIGGNNVAGVAAFPGDETKPYRCPVIGCEKAYKNQNGLKYHKQHGHQNQQLKENTDGTYSIVDPTTSIPYPGTVGMEKEKPYRCDVCGKRYKNLNGLKYHRQHSPQCNSDLKLNTTSLAGVAGNAQGMSVNVAGAGLMGLGDATGF